VTVTSAHNFFTGFTENVSEGGVFVATYQLQELGTEMDVTLKLEDGEEIALSGVVRWVRLPSDDISVQPGMGLQFNSLDERTAAKIEKFISSRRESLFFDDDDIDE